MILLTQSGWPGPLTHITLRLELSICVRGSSPFPGRAKPEFSSSPSSPRSAPPRCCPRPPISYRRLLTPGFPPIPLRTHRRGDFRSAVTGVAKALSPVPKGLTLRGLSGAKGGEIGTGKRRATLWEFWPLPVLPTSQTLSYLRILHSLFLPPGRLSLPRADGYPSFPLQLNYPFTAPSHLLDQVPLFLFLFLIYFY